MNYIIYREGDELYHSGVKGMRWGVRRYQNEDGSLTDMGKRHYDLLESQMVTDRQNRAIKARMKIERRKEKSAVKLQKAEIKAARKNQKRQAKMDKLEYKKMKIEIKKMKQEAAYMAGKRFSENFMPEFSRAFGRTSGAALGSMLNNFNAIEWTNSTAKWYESRAKYLNAKHGKKPDDD